MKKIKCEDLLEVCCLIRYFDENKSCSEIKDLYKLKKLMYVIKMMLEFDMFPYSLIDNDFEMLYSLISDYRFEGKININDFNNINELISLINDRKQKSEQFWSCLKEERYSEIKKILENKVLRATYFKKKLIKASYLDRGMLFGLWESEFYILKTLYYKNAKEILGSIKVILSYPYTECAIIELLNTCLEDLTKENLEFLQALLIKRLETVCSKKILKEENCLYKSKRELKKSIENVYYCLEDLKKVKKDK